MLLQQKSLEYVTLHTPQISFSPSPGFFSTHWASLACSVAQPCPPHYNILGSEWVYNHAILQKNRRLQHFLVILMNFRPKSVYWKNPHHCITVHKVWLSDQGSKNSPCKRKKKDILFPVAPHTTAVGSDTGPCQLSLYICFIYVLPSG